LYRYSAALEESGLGEAMVGFGLEVGRCTLNSFDP
jgi:hypothetical protein